MSDKPEINATEASAENTTEIPTSTEDQATISAEMALPPHKRYIQRIKKFQKYYTQLVIIIGAIIVISVIIAVVYNLIIGVSTVIFAAILYNSWASSEMYKELGIKYKSITGGIIVTSCKARYGDIMWIPASLIRFDVIEIDDRAFAKRNNESLTKLFLPKTLKKIGTDIFDGCDSLKEIFFEGSEEEWNNVEKNTDFSCYKVIFEAKYPPIIKKKKKLSRKK